MTLDQNDWRLTAYALNELDDTDRAEVEAVIAASPELARMVDEIRATAGMLETALAVELALSHDNSSSPLAKGGHRGVGGARKGFARRIFLPLAAAASIALAAGIGWYTLVPSLSRSQQIAMNAPLADSVSPLDSAPTERRARQDQAELERPTPEELVPIPESEIPWHVELLYPDEWPEKKQTEGDSNQDLKAHPAKFHDATALADAVSKVLPEETMDEARTSRKAIIAPSTIRAKELAEYIRQHPEQSVQQQVAQNVAAPNYPKCESTGFEEGHPVSDWFQTASAGGHYAGGYHVVSIDGVPTNEPGDDLTRCIKFNLFPGACAELAPPESPGFEDYRAIQENPFRLVENDPLSTFSIDVDTASYANVRRWITSGSLPPPDAVRIEEMINYFDYAYPQPVDEHPFAVHVEVAQCPWNGAHRLARIGIKGYEIAPQDRPPANLVFLIDVSGSMQPANKLPLLREALSLMVDELHRDDTVGIVVYAGASGIVLSPTNNKDVIRSSLNGLMAGGGTNGAAGIEAAYQLAEDTFVPGGINRVILATDGDFNVGLTGSGDLQRLIEEKAKSGVFLTVLGFGMGNYKDGTLETLADKGNGNYAYIDTLNEAQKVLIEQMEGTLVTIAKDVKIQVEFNPLAASAYRLIGYENRMLAAQDFNDDKKDAGEIGAGHTVTALYEIVPVGQDVDVPLVDELKYQTVTELTAAADSGELMTVKLRYKEPEEDESKLIDVPVLDSGATFEESSDDFAFAASVAAFGMLLRHSEHVGPMNFAAVAEFAEGAKGQDLSGYRAEFIDLVRMAESIAGAPR